VIDLWNAKLNEHVSFADPAALVMFLWDRIRTRGHYALSYDDITVRAPDGWTHVHRGDYVLLHALAGVPIPGIAEQPTVSIAAAAAAAAGSQNV
jgi:hypothetical protein